MSQKNAQSAIEFVVLVGFVLFFFFITYSIVQENTADKQKERQSLIVKDAALAVQDEINLALQSSEGYYRSFKIPENVGNQEYNITIVEEMVYIRTQDGKNAMAFPVQNVTGQLVKGDNTIKKENGKIKLND